tara:strand:+ start:115 stop:264 length:150 start_codon:yes stop_codon:yes gene_type:complete
MKEILKIIAYLYTNTWVGILIVIVLIFLLADFIGIDPTVDKPPFFTGQE